MSSQHTDLPIRCIHFPYMHAELLPPHLSGAAAFFDPGLGAARDGRPVFRPENLPLDEAALTAAIRQYEELEREVRDPRELDAFFASRFEDVFPESAHGIRDALRDRMTPGHPRASQALAVKAQLGLCLAWRLEEKLVELSDLGRGFDQGFTALAESLGLSSDDERELPSGLFEAAAISDPRDLVREYGSSWRPLLSAMLRFVPAGVGLLVTEASVVDAWVEAGLFSGDTPRPAVSDFVPGEFAGLVTAVSLPGWRLMLAGRPRPESPWLDAPRVVLYPVTPEE